MPEFQVKVKILGWKYINIRGLQTMEVDLEQHTKTPYPISLIMMPNGQGKTTTMELLTATLTGTAERWNRIQVMELRPPNSEDVWGEFQLRLLIDGQRTVIALHFDYAKGTASYATTRVDAHGGNESGFYLPASLRGVFNEQFVKRFIFDGELVKDILSGTKDEAEKTIRYLYNLDRLDDLMHAIEAVKRARQDGAEKTTSKTDRGLTRLRNQRDIAEERVRNLRSKQDDLQKRLQKVQEEVTKIEKFLRDRLAQSAELKKRFDDWTQQRMAVRQNLQLRTQYLVENLRDPAMASRLIFMRLNDLSNHLLRLKLPESTSRQFFVELAEEKFCVCGRPIGERERQTIGARAEKYLGHDEYGVVNAIKQAIRRAEFDDTLTNTVKDVQTLLDKDSQIQTELRRIEYKQKESGDEEVRQAIDNKARLEQEMQSLKEQIEKNRRDLKKAEADYDEVRAKFEEATQTANFIRHADKLKHITQRAASLALANLKHTIIENTNRRIAQLIHLEEIAVEAIDGHLKLFGKEGASQGQSLAIAYAFLGSLFADAAFGLPFVVDSPAGPLDLDVRREVATMLPDLFEQLILLVMSGEREGFCSTFYELPNVQFLTVIKGPTVLPKGAAIGTYGAGTGTLSSCYWTVHDTHL